MPVTLSMPIHWLCLRLISKFYSPISPSPKSLFFTLTWPVTSSVTSRSNCWPCSGSLCIEWRLKFGNRSSSLGDLRGALCPPPPTAGRVTNQTPAGRGLMCRRWVGFLGAKPPKPVKFAGAEATGKFYSEPDSETEPVQLVENCKNARGRFSTGPCSVHSLSTDFSCSYHRFILIRT